MMLSNVYLKTRFVKFIYKALNHNNSVIKSVTKYAYNNPISVCSRNWSEFMCVKEFVTENLKEIYNEWYKSVHVEEMHTLGSVIVL